MPVTVELEEGLAAELSERGNASEALGDVVARALRDWLDQTDARTERGSAVAVLLDEIGASAGGELPIPDRETLGEWLGLLSRAMGLRSEPD